MSDFVFGCPACQREFRITPEFAGTIVQCPHCLQKLRIPADLFTADVAGQPPQSSQKPKQSHPPESKLTSLDPAHSLKATGSTQTTSKSEPVSQPKTPSSSASKRPKIRDDAKSQKGKWRNPKTQRVNPPTQTSSADPSTEVRPKPADAPKSTALPQVQNKTIEPNLKSDPNPSQSVSIIDVAGDGNTPPLVPAVSPILPPAFQTPEPPNENESQAHSGADPNSSANENQAVIVADLVGNPAAEPSETETPAASMNSGEPLESRLPPKFFVPMSNSLSQAGGEGRVLLPTAEGGVQSVNERLVTIEYRGKKYLVLAATPEEKRRRQIIANVISVLIAIAAILGTIWILMN